VSFIVILKIMNTRPQELTEAFKQLIDNHLADLVNLRAIEMLEIEQFAELLHVHPTHLSNTRKGHAIGSASIG